MEILRKAWEEESLILDLEASNLDEIFHAALELIVDQKRLAAEHRDRVEQALHEREQQVSTAIGHAVAVPPGNRKQPKPVRSSGTFPRWLTATD